MVVTYEPLCVERFQFCKGLCPAFCKEGRILFAVTFKALTPPQGGPRSQAAVETGCRLTTSERGLFQDTTPMSPESSTCKDKRCGKVRLFGNLYRTINTVLAFQLEKGLLLESAPHT